jgi:hypothetical protein
MTIETCKIRYELAKKNNDSKEMEFWKARIERKVSRHPKYKDINVSELLGEKKDGKKSKG